FGILQAVGSSVQTDAAGQFTFSDVPPGSYKVSFQLGNNSASRDVTVNPGESTAIETVFLGAGGGGTTPVPGPGNPTTRGHVLLVDAGRAVQLDPKAQIAWRYLSSGISAATRLPDGNTVVADEQLNKVWVIGPGGEVVWDMGFSVGLFSRLNAPSWVAAARDGKSFLITDAGNNRIIEIENRTAGWHFDQLSRPRSATYVPGNGNVLIADTGNKRVIEVDRLGQLVWSFDKDMLAPVHAVRLDDGNTLITDAGYNRVIMINPQGQPVWFYDGAGAQPLNRPRSTIPTRFGTYMIADTGNNRVVEVDRGKQIVSSIPNLSRPQVIERL
ncbi:MAG: carboxypeptidase regulatory-like domain-containing protein, partial [Candidatus Sericytochromatia bacterium]